MFAPRRGQKEKAMQAFQGKEVCQKSRRKMPILRTSRKSKRGRRSHSSRNKKGRCLLCKVSRHQKV